MAGGGDWNLGLLKHQNLRGEDYIEETKTQKRKIWTNFTTSHPTRHKQLGLRGRQTKYKVAAKRLEKLSIALLRLHVREKK